MRRASIVNGQRRHAPMGSLLLVCGLASLTASSAAKADVVAPGVPAPDAARIEAERKEAARGKLIEGDGLLKQGAYQDALTAFKEAYAIYPSPKIHYNFGLALQGMGRGAESLEAFERFLAEAKDAPPETRAKASAARDDLLARVGTLRVTADVAGASILVDGREVGRTPFAGDIRLDPGPHMLTIDRGAGQVPFTQRLIMRAGTATPVDARLADGTGGTREPSSPGGASAQGDAAGSSLARSGDAPGSSPGWLRPAAWTAAGIGAAALVVGSVSWAIKESKFKSFNDDPACDQAFANDGGPMCHDRLSTGQTAKTVGIAGFVTAGVFGVASAAAFVALASGRGSPGVVTVSLGGSSSGSSPGAPSGAWWGASWLGHF